MLAPKPEVVHLPTLFRRIKSGAIRVPAFQREFVWKEGQILALLASVYQGFPIGSILLWRVEQELLRVQTSEVTAFPDLPLTFPMAFVLDGMQRLSTLYGVCNYEGDPTDEDKFNVLFDLTNNEFVHYDPDELPTHYVPLAALFSPKRLMELQIDLVKTDNSNGYLEKVVELHAKFQEYLVPTVTIENQDVNKVVNIFERVNNTGTKLSSVDFMRAVTWSDAFDLSDRIRQVQGSLNDNHYTLDDDTIVKALGIVNGLDPLPDILLSLRQLSSRRLQESVEEVSSGLIRVQDFIRSRFNVFGSDYVPYEGQVLVIFKALTLGRSLNTDQEDALERWFWTTGFNEALRGKPDNFVARTINAVQPALFEGKTGLSKRLQVTPFEFRGRRFIRSKALSATMAAMFAKNNARSIVTGDVIPQQEYMTTWNQKQFVSILPADVLKAVSSESLTSGRLLCNIAVASKSDLDYFARCDPASCITQKFWDGGYEDVLSSQFIGENAAQELVKLDFDRFLDARSEDLFRGAENLVRGQPDDYHELI